jgi:hypothetical protein
MAYEKARKHWLRHFATSPLRHVHKPAVEESLMNQYFFYLKKRRNDYKANTMGSWAWKQPASNENVKVHQYRLYLFPSPEVIVMSRQCGFKDVRTNNTVAHIQASIF